MNSKRVLLLDPPFYRLYGEAYSLTKYPLALGYLSSVVLRDTDWEVQTLSADFNPRGTENITLAHMAGKGFELYLRNLHNPGMPIWREIEAAIRDFKPGVVGISAKTQNYASAKLVAAIAKRLDPDTIVIVGGPHASMVGGNALEQCAEMDIAVKGEGEITLVEILKALEKGESARGIPGTVVRHQGEMAEGPPRAQIQDLDSLPFPHQDAERVLRNYHTYPLRAFRFVFATRGCPYACEFCGSRNIWTRKVRYRSAQNVVDEIAAMRAKGLRDFHFDDDTFGISKKYIRDLCTRLAEQCPDIYWSCETTVNVINKETVDLMKRAGCIRIQLGVESGNNAMLKRIHKNIKIERAYEAVDLIVENGITAQTFFMAGFPEETEETLADTYEAIRRINSSEIIFSVFTPYPQTDGFRVCLEAGLVDDTYDVSLYNHQSPENCFTRHIPPERFKSLIHKMMIDVDRINRRRRWERRFRVGYRNLREKGVRYTFAKTLRVLTSR